MYDSVKAFFPIFTRSFEGATDWFYCDVKGLVTIGYGNLADPLSLVSDLLFTVDGRTATPDEILADWRKVKNHQELDLSGGGAFQHLTTVRACPDSITKLVGRKLASLEAVLRTLLTNWDTVPADAQLGALSMGWAMGGHFPVTWPHFTAAFLAGQWAQIGTPGHPLAPPASCWMKELGQNASFHKRNLANVELFLNADRVVQTHLDPSVLQHAA